MEQLVTLLVFCFAVPLIIFIGPIVDCVKNKKGIIRFFRENYVEFILYFVIAIGTLVRLYAIDKYPNALNVDEASIGYEAFSLLKYGIDRAGNTYPVYLYAWGSGQSVLYSIILMPFIFYIGLCEYAIRLPMAIVGIISIYAFYYLVKNIFDNKKIALVGTAFFVICPWHIMKTRFGMEANLFPDLVLWATCLIGIGIKRKSLSFYTIGFIILAFSAYSYATSFVFLPIFIIAMLVYFYKRKLITKEWIIYGLLISIIIATPLMAYVVVNVFKLHSLRVGPFTIPRLSTNRALSATSIFSGDIYSNLIQNILNTFSMILLQTDGLPWNAISGDGLFYGISIVFLLYGMYFGMKKFKYNSLNGLMNIFFVSSLVVCMFTIPNINRANILMIPCIYYIAIGLYYFSVKFKLVIPYLILVYICLFVCFGEDYINSNYDEYFTFKSGVKEVVEYCEKSDAEYVHVEYAFKEPYIYFLFYSKYDVKDYMSTVRLIDEKGNFDNVRGFGKYTFDEIPETVEKNSIVVVTKGAEVDFTNNIKNKITINQYDIYEF